VEGTAPLQNASNRSPRGQWGELPRSQFPLNGSLTILTQSTALFQLSTQSQNKIFGSGSGSSRVMRKRRTIIPSDPSIDDERGETRGARSPPRHESDGPPSERGSTSVLTSTVSLPSTRGVREALTVHPFGRPAVAAAKAFGRH